MKKSIETKRLQLNEGQMQDLPANPRFIRDEKFEALKKSIEESPEFLDARPLLVYPIGKDFIVIGGNMRLRACKELNIDKIPCYVFPKQTPAKKLREFVIKDNLAYGEIDWETIANEWDYAELQEWSFDLPDWVDEEPPTLTDEEAETETEKLSDLQFNDIYYEPENKPNITLADCVNLDKFNAKLDALNEYDLTAEQRETLKMFAYRFIKIDFENVANYYAFNATAEERKAIERLRLVLVDGSLEGFINDDLLRVANDMNEELTTE